MAAHDNLRSRILYDDIIQRSDCCSSANKQAKEKKRDAPSRAEFSFRQTFWATAAVAKDKMAEEWS